MDRREPDDEGDRGYHAHVPGFPAPEILRQHCGGQRPAVGLGECGAKAGAELHHGQSPVCGGIHDDKRAKK